MGEEKSNEDYTPIKYKLKNKELGLNGFYEYTKIGENKIKLRKITCENYVENTDEENSENTDMKNSEKQVKENFKCKDFTKESGVESGKPVVIDLNYDKDKNNPKTRYIMFLKALVNIPDDEDDQLPEGLKLTEEETNNTPLYITNKEEYIKKKQLVPKQGGKRKTRRHRKNSKKNKSRSSKKRKSNKKKRKTVKKRRLRKQK